MLSYTPPSLSPIWRNSFALSEPSYFPFVMDADGNIFSMTESDGHLDTPLIPGWAFGLGDNHAVRLAFTSSLTDLADA